MEKCRRINYTTYYLDNDHNIIKIDDNFTIITGYTKEDIESNNMNQIDLIPESDQEEYVNLVEKTLEETGEVYLEHRIYTKDGRHKIVFCLGAPEKEKNRIIVRLIDLSECLSIEVLKQQYKEKVLKYAKDAYTDNLTGLYRREYFKKKLKNLMKEQWNLTIIMIDVDDFKHVNDTYGHKVGDKILISCAETFKRNINNGFACRLGGDEFVIVLETNDYDYVIDAIDCILSDANKIRIAEDENYRVGLSIGVKFLEKTDSYEKLYEDVDKALYIAKSNGKNQYAIYKD